MRVEKNGSWAVKWFVVQVRVIDMSVVRDLRIVRVRHIISALAGGLVGLLFDTGWIVEHL